MKFHPLSPSLIRDWVKEALAEDLGAKGDATSSAIIPARARSRARLVARGKGVLCGIDFAMQAFRQQDPGANFKARRGDGHQISAGEVVLEVCGNTRAILEAERTALNFVQQLSGVATLTRRYVRAAKRAARGSKIEILDTRKTTPLFRELQKYAVRCGGGVNHRFGLFDMVLIKDNHLAALAPQVRDPIREAVRQARMRWPKLPVEVECDTLEQVAQAVAAGADFILLDNMPPAQLRSAVRIVKRRAKTEASGGVNLENIAAIARTGVDRISVGALTHSAAALDFSLEMYDTR